MTPRTEELRDSFSQLKKTAKSHNDLLAWFESNPDCLPLVPASLSQYVTMNIQNIVTFVGLNSNDEPEYTFTLNYRVHVPPINETYSSIEAFDNIVGCKTGPWRPGEQQAPHFDEKIVLHLPAVEWRFVAALWAFSILEGEMEMQAANVFFDRKVWAKTFPDLPWDIVRSMHDAGIAPEENQAFSAWVCSFHEQTGPHLPLPTTLAP